MGWLWVLRRALGREQQSLKAGVKSGMPANTAPISDFMTFAAREKGLIVTCAHLDRGGVEQLAQQHESCAFVFIVGCVLSEVDAHELKLTLPFIDQLILESLQLVEADKILADPLRCLNIRTVVIEYCLLQVDRRPTYPLKLGNEGISV